MKCRGAVRMTVSILAISQSKPKLEHTPHWGTPSVRLTEVEVAAAAELEAEAAMAVAAKMAREV
jgi:hypothetical protein